MGITIGGAAGDTLSGGSSYDTLIGGGGGDSLTGVNGSDELFGGAGADTLVGAGYDRLDGGAGADQIHVGPRANVVVIGQGESALFGPSYDTIYGWPTFDPWDTSTRAYIAFASGAPGSGKYVELQADGFDAAVRMAYEKIGGGSADVVAISVGADVYVFADSAGNNVSPDDAVRIVGTDLSQISAETFIGAPLLNWLGYDPTPDYTYVDGPGSGGVIFDFGDDLVFGMEGNDYYETGRFNDTLNGGAGDDTLLGGYGADALIGGPGRDLFEVSYGHSWPTGSISRMYPDQDRIIDWEPGDRLWFEDLPTASGDNYQEYVAASFEEAYQRAGADAANGFIYSVAQVGLDVVVFARGNGASYGVILKNRTLADISPEQIGTSPAPYDVVGGPGADTLAGARGDDTLAGGDGDDRLLGESGQDILSGGGGHDYLDGGYDRNLLYGGAGDDTLTSYGRESILRGEDGHDSLHGGWWFDDMHGGPGADTVGGREGDDWVVGGQGEDVLSGDEGRDVVLGNLGDDSCYGGAGDDVIRGGQGQDNVQGGTGDDWLSGDRGEDLLRGGPGADTFNFFAEAHVDRVVDFDFAEGDRVRLEPGSTYSAVQVGDDTVITVGAAKMILTGVTLAALGPDWIFVA